MTRVRITRRVEVFDAVFERNTTPLVDDEELAELQRLEACEPLRPARQPGRPDGLRIGDRRIYTR